MKTVSVVIPTYNEEDNIVNICNRVRELFLNALQSYDYEIIFIDNHSTDRSREIIEKLCRADKGVKAIFNARNFGFNRSVYYGLLQGTGDCTALIFADMQDPPEMLVDFVRAWEQGHRIVVGVKTKSRENSLMYAVRSAFYKGINRITEISHIDQYDGFGLYDKSFIEVLKTLNDPMPYLRGIVAELGYDRLEISYEQRARVAGKTTFSFMRYYDVAMLGITSYSKVVMRLATICGFIMSIISFLIGIVTLIIKLVNWEYFEVGFAALLVGVFFLGSILLFFLGFQGEYILSINTRVMNRPLVVEDKRLNFGERDASGREISAATEH
ncbi:MAG: glycosyltransferase family 2 protein [Lachnospiraceae bacterium]|nr:glycosyltransferase family 2 protein [Lachnospiraceae bacterium]